MLYGWGANSVGLLICSRAKMRRRTEMTWTMKRVKASSVTGPELS